MVSEVGKAMLKCEVPSTKEIKQLTFFIIKEPYNAILGQDACEDLHMIKRIGVEELSEPKTLTSEAMLEEFKDVFTGVGQFKKEYNIEVDIDVPGVIQPPRRFPYTRLEKLKTTLEKMENQEIVASVDKPTDWVSNLTVVEKKNGTLRVCLDPKPLNEAIKRERHSIPLPEDVQHKLNGKKVFTILDERSGFWQVKLTDKSSYLTTFNTPWGRKRFLRMPFGISSASEVMQKRNEETFGDIPDVHIIADDMIIAGKDEEEHDATFRKVMKRAREQNVKFNPEKIQFKVPKVIYMGTEITKDGLRPDPKKVEAITMMPKPQNKQELRSLLGMVKYVSHFIPNESSITAPLRSLLKEDAAYQWQHEHDKTLETLKETLSTRPVLRFYDVTKAVKIQCDASQYGLGACLLQENQPVAYASRALTITERNYSQVEKELLSVVFACEKFHQYVFGKDITVQNDHKPLLGIMKKPLSKASPRLQRLQMKLSGYRVQLEWLSGSKMVIADMLSRAPVGMAEQTLQDDEVLIHTLVENLPISAVRIGEMKEATREDTTLQDLKDTVMKGWPRYKRNTPLSIRPYWPIREEINVREEMLFRGDRIIIPYKMRSEMLDIIHESHLGIAKCKARANQVVYWPGMSKDIEEKVEKCSTCLTYRQSNVKEPMKPHSIPGRPWQKLGADLLEWKGKNYLVVADYFSRYPEVELLSQKTAKAVIAQLKSIISRHGIPEEIVSDNVSFGSVEFRQFAKEWGIKVTTSSPTYAQSNGLAEKTVQTVKLLMKKADMDGRDPYIALLDYRNTPISGMTYSPAQLLMSRSLRTKLPTTDEKLKPRVVRAREQLRHVKDKQQKYYNQGARHLPSLKPGDVVRVRKEKVWKPAVVVKSDIHPRSYIVNHDGREYRRNRRDLMKTNEPIPKMCSPPSLDIPLSLPNESPSNSEDEPVSRPVILDKPSSPKVLLPSKATCSSPIVKTRSGRVSRPPSRYGDYVKE